MIIAILIMCFCAWLCGRDACFCCDRGVRTCPRRALVRLLLTQRARVSQDDPFKHRQLRSMPTEQEVELSEVRARCCSRAALLT